MLLVLFVLCKSQMIGSQELKIGAIASLIPSRPNNTSEIVQGVFEDVEKTMHLSMMFMNERNRSLR